MITVYSKVNEDARLYTIDNELKRLQRAVGGYIEEVPLTETISLVCNEEGKIQELPMNYELYHNGTLLDVICGNVLFVGSGAEDFRSLTFDEIAILHDILHNEHNGIHLEKIIEKV